MGECINIMTKKYIEFVGWPENFSNDMTGARYEMVQDFKPISRDWNNDGDEYTEVVATFSQVKNSVDGHAPKKLTLTNYTYNDLLRSG
jgi:hypothetical protein